MDLDSSEALLTLSLSHYNEVEASDSVQVFWEKTLFCFKPKKQLKRNFTKNREETPKEKQKKWISVQRIYVKISESDERVY